MQPAAYLVDIAETKPDRRNSLSSRCAHRRHRVLHSWGSAMTHYPHIHMIVPGGGISLDGERWVSSRARFLLPVRVLAKLFRRLFLDNLQQLHASGHLQFFGDRICLIERRAFLRHLAPQRKKRWVVYLQATALRVGSGARLFVAIHPPRRARYQRRILHRDRRVVTRHDEPQPAVEAMRLRPVGRHVPASVTRPTTTMSPAKSPCLPPSQHLHDAPTQLTCHQLSQVNPIPQSPHHLYSRSKILKSP